MQSVGVRGFIAVQELPRQGARTALSVGGNESVVRLPPPSSGCKRLKNLNLASPSIDIATGRERARTKATATARPRLPPPHLWILLPYAKNSRGSGRRSFRDMPTSLSRVMDAYRQPLQPYNPLPKKQQWEIG